MSNQDKTNNEVFAKANYIRVSPQKVMRIANLIRHKNVEESLQVLKLLPHDAAKILYKVLHSAMSNAIHNDKMEFNNLVVSTLLVNKGVFHKRHRARARGRVASITKKTSKIVVGVSSQLREK